MTITIKPDAAGPAGTARRHRSSPTWVRSMRYWMYQYKRTWRGSITTSFLYPVLYLAAMGLGLPAAVATASPSGAVTRAPAWKQLQPATVPSARYGASMAYDAASHQVVLFGGAGTGVFSTTWTWDGTNWTEQLPADSPAARSAIATSTKPCIGFA